MPDINRESISNGMRVGWKLVLQLFVPALAAAVASYVAVASQLVRLEEQLISIRQEMQLRQSYVERDIEILQRTDALLAAELVLLRKSQ